MRSIGFACVVLFAFAVPVGAQGTPSSSWGVVGSFVPRWDIPSSLEPLAVLHFSEDDAAIGDLDLRGQEFRIGVARGRMRSGDWGVSFVRKTFVDRAIAGYRSPGCQGGSSSGVVVLQCQETWTDLDRRDVMLNGVEVHKFIAFATISQLVQIGLNVGGGIGSTRGHIETTSFQQTYKCTFPPGVLPAFPDPGDPDSPSVCSTAAVSNIATVQTGATSDDVSRMLKSTSKLLPLGKVEIAAAVLVAPRLKVRVSGGLNYPGTHRISVTGLYFFGGN
jgi:hypothetical protein